MKGERPRWPEAPARGHDASVGIKELSENCWNSDPAWRPTAQEVVEALARVISDDVIWALIVAFDANDLEPNDSQA
jgi:hypothetical protein